tara:strand:+ start:43 stop:804 length:762 start_codon:yes stop_codon:yes gene_type:complete
MSRARQSSLRKKQHDKTTATRTGSLLKKYQEELNRITTKGKPSLIPSIDRRRNKRLAFLKKEILRLKNSPAYHASQFKKQSKNVERSNPNYGKGGEHETSNKKPPTKPNTEDKTNTTKTSNKPNTTKTSNKPNTTNTTDSKKTTNKDKIKIGDTQGKNVKPNPQLRSQNVTTSRSKHETGHSAKISAAKQEAKDRDEWLKNTRNSPAARAGIGDDKRWALQKKHRQWKADRKSGALKKKRKQNLRILSPMDMD